MKSGGKPRVLYIINAFNRGGAELGLLQLVAGGAFAEHDLYVIGLVRGSGEPLEALQALGVDVKVLWKSTRLRPLQWLMAVPRLVAEIRRYAPDLAILSLPQANIAGRLALAFSFKRTVTASFEHNTHLAKPIYESLFRWTSGLVDWLIADCDATAMVALERLYLSKPETVIALPLLQLPAVEPHERPATFTVLNAARFTEVKRQRVLVEACRWLRDRGMDVRFVLCGDGELLHELRTLADTLGVGDLVDFPGFQPSWEATPANVYAVPSLHEGLCISALEAMNMGLPLISTRVGGVVDYGGKAEAIFVEDSTAEAFGEAIALLVRDPERAMRMAHLGAEVAQELFGSAQVARRYSEFAGLVNRIASAA